MSRRVIGTGLRQRENRKHRTARMAEYVDCFFKDAPKSDWMRGVRYLDNGKRDVSVFFKKSTDRD